MKDFVWIAAAGVVLYILYENGYFGTATTAATGTSTSPQANDNSTTTGATATGGTSVTGTTATSTNQPLPSLDQVIALMQQYGQDPTKSSWSQYVYQTYYNMLSPANPVPSNLASLSALGSNAVGIDTWWSAMQAGIPGLSGFGGLGMISNRVNPYLLGPRTSFTKKYGAGLALNGPEQMVRVLGQG